jgi:hypothetical protein
MKIVLSGASGLVGSALYQNFTGKGHAVTRLVRSGTPEQDELLWDPYGGALDKSALEGVDCLIHLSGESLAGRWNTARKKTMWDSRVETTRFLSKTIVALDNPPKVWICASAIGYYSDRGDEELTEESAPGQTFLSWLCQNWESSTNEAKKSGIRVVNTRFGLILDRNAKAFQLMLTPFQLGVGGRIGSGQQYWAWVSLEDVVASISHIIRDDTISGPVNIVSPAPLRNAEFTKILGRVMHRPTIFFVPEFAMRLTFGEMGKELLLASNRVLPKKLEDFGYKFKFEDLESCLRGILNRPR